MLPEAIEDRQREGSRLAGPGLRGREDIATGQDERDGLFLDGRRPFIALFGDGPNEIGRQAERVKGHATPGLPPRAEARAERC